MARHAGPSYFPASFFPHQHDQLTHQSNSILHDLLMNRRSCRYETYSAYIYILFYAQQLWLKTEITSEPFWTQKRTPHFEIYPYTYLVGYHWRLDYANKPPTAKQIGLNRCSFGHANKHATYSLRLWTKQWSPIYHWTYLVGPHCVAAWKADQVRCHIQCLKN